MLTVRDLMMPDPLTVGAEDTLRSAADLLISAGIGGAPVMASGRVIGMLSLRDVLAFEVDDPGVPLFRPEALEPFEDIAPDEADGIGDPGAWFRTLWEDSGAEVSNRMEEPDGPEWDPLDEHTVAEVMSRDVFHIGPLAPVTEAAGMMEKQRLHRLLVLDEGKPVGILTTWDIARAVAQGQLIPARPGPTLVL